ncbi:hypothetical protein BT67DRAFT_303528 [Trichocladium antarcticum]|uniref:RNA polymerase II subunit B1 CTD phosphatase RPAP2 homolog n=1 Tax=Trichocladium antarcticum TaxID=1450529 RepID=A0AAN6ZDW4_9PEZI|nr:hypothetical protein BT67DRAFT_303528 [Trichocladium antarcticum]
MSAETQPPAKSKPKGILKKPTAAPPSTEPDAASAAPPLTRTEQLARQEALARVRLFQQLRDTELKPPVSLETFELLSQLPRAPSPQHSASRPSAGDSALLLAELARFQPSEYLDLVEERNCLGKCGYALCGRPRRNHPGEFKLAAGVARTADLNKWCSDACALRALYLKVQLDNPSYERVDGKMAVKLELREEKHRPQAAAAAQATKSAAAVPRGEEQDRKQLAQEMAQLQRDKTRQVKRDASALAVERGDACLFAGGGKVEVTIREKTTDGAAQPPSQEDDSHLMVEGHKTTFGTDKKLGENGDSDHDSDSDDDPFPTIRL